jgi:predicted nucleic acid-binding protein
LHEFAQRVTEGLEGASWATKREILRALIKRVEVDAEEVRVVYKVDPRPFVEGPGAPDSIIAASALHLRGVAVARRDAHEREDSRRG